MDLIFRRPATDVVHQEVNQYGRDLAASLGETHQVAAKYPKTSQETMKKYYDLRVKKKNNPVRVTWFIGLVQLRLRERFASPIWKAQINSINVQSSRK